jgi:hypothetical protein
MPNRRSGARAAEKPPIKLIGEDQAAILTGLMVHVLDLQLKRQVVVPRSCQTRMSLIIDEALTAAGGQLRQGTAAFNQSHSSCSGGCFGDPISPRARPTLMANRGWRGRFQSRDVDLGLRG